LEIRSEFDALQQKYDELKAQPKPENDAPVPGENIKS